MGFFFKGLALLLILTATLATVIIYASTVSSSPGSEVWSKTFGGAGDEWAFSVIATSDGGYAIAGYTNSFGAGANDFWLLKIDASGNSQWNRTFGGLGDDRAYAMVRSADGGYAMVGSSNSYGNTTGMWLVKTNSNGWASWDKIYDYSDASFDADTVYGIVQTVTGAFAITGTMGSHTTNPFTRIFVTDAEFGVAMVAINAVDVTLYRGRTDPYWNYVRVRIWVLS